MPEYNVLIGKRTYKVELTKKDERLFEAKINEKPVELELEQKEPGTSSPFAIRVAGQEYQVKVGKIKRHRPFHLEVNNVSFNVKLGEPTRKAAATIPTVQVPIRKQEGAIKEGAVVAPMAGKIITVKVKEGDAVKAGDVICTLEAMKMENEITATKTGKIKEIHVTEGSPVNERDIIAIIK